MVKPLIIDLFIFLLFDTCLSLLRILNKIWPFGSCQMLKVIGMTHHNHLLTSLYMVADVVIEVVLKSLIPKVQIVMSLCRYRMGGLYTFDH